jgi:tetratricopeptide (TPR) repeat protein
VASLFRGGEQVDCPSHEMVYYIKLSTRADKEGGSFSKSVPPVHRHGGLNQHMPRSQRNDNFIDKTFTVIADILLKVLPTSQREKQAFMYYRDGMSAQSSGEYAEALQNYYQAMRFETDAYDRSYILYNIGLIHTSNGEHGRALEYYYQALERNPSLPQALNNIAVIYHYRGEQAIENGNLDIATLLFDKAADYWKEAIRLAPTNYIEAVNWLQMSDRLQLR